VNHTGLNVVMIVTNDAVSDPRVTKEAVALVTAGHRVTVLAWDRGGGAPESEVRSGVTYERFGPRAAYGSGWRTLPRFNEFWHLTANRVLELQADVVHCHDMDTAVAGLRVLKRKPDTRLVIDHHELYRHTKMVPQRGLVGLTARSIVDTLDRRVARKAAAIVIANPGNLDRYERMMPGKVVSVENAPEATLFVPQYSDEDEGPFTVCFIGQKRYLPSLEILIRVMRRHPEMQALLAGGGVVAEQVERIAADVVNVHTVGRVLYEDIPGLYAGCDAVYAIYDATVGNVRTGFQVKALEGMASGIPVLAQGGTWLGDFVEKERIGITVPSLDDAAIESALVRLAEDPGAAREMGMRGRKLVDERLSWECAAKRLVDVYEELAR